jgi:predicted metallopeptidase
VIINKINVKIEIFKKSEKFQKLSYENKIKVIDYIQNKIDKKISEMSSIKNKTEILNTKIEIY